MKGYIAIEGLDGAGKSTAAKAIYDFFKDKEIKNVREPGGTPLAEQMRNLVKTDTEGEEIDVETETFLFFGARNQLLTQVVKPFLDQGNIVVSDRCFLSSVAYQATELVELLSDRLKIKPELIIYVDITPEIGLERAKSREELDRIEKKGTEFFHQARANYLEMVEANDNIKMVDGHPSIEEVYASVTKVLQDFYG